MGYLEVFPICSSSQQLKELYIDFSIISNNSDNFKSYFFKKNSCLPLSPATGQQPTRAEYHFVNPVTRKFRRLFARTGVPPGFTATSSWLKAVSEIFPLSICLPYPIVYVWYSLNQDGEWRAQLQWVNLGLAEEWSIDKGEDVEQ
ncbi:hypothetical protein OUZ56_021879 [Daphnia magna]|uniref:Uncharacterized protein n=1 Tax=Daphnia magna TaxID=35525 RepID=A0ABR0AUU1_9CRUS|nr:hypothetical protein OUZ56_021879 [Daphnia magna]